MTYPISLQVTFDFGSGPSFAPAFVIGVSQLGTASLQNSASIVVDLTSQTVGINIRRGRDLTQDKFNSGTCQIRVLDLNGDWNPQNVTSPYYGLLQPLRKLQITASHNSVTYNLFAGYTLSYDYTYPRGEELGYITITANDALSLFNKSAISTVTGATAGETTGSRINDILNTIGFPSSQRSIDTGQSTVQADPGTVRSVLQALQTVEFTEFGALYISGAGDVIFRDRNDTATSIAGTPTVFNQTTGINYANLKFAFDDKLIFNVAQFTRTGGSTQTVSDQTSIDTYFPHTITVDGLLNQSDSEVLSLAQAYVASRKSTDIRIDAMSLDLTTPNYTAGIAAALGLDFFDPVTITNEQPGGSTLTKNLQIFGVQHQITPTTWMTTLTTGEPVLDAFILNSTSFGIIGTSVLSY
jgi:hypothetical protein